MLRGYTAAGGSDHASTRAHGNLCLQDLDTNDPGESGKRARPPMLVVCALLQGLESANATSLEALLDMPSSAALPGWMAGPNPSMSQGDFGVTEPTLQCQKPTGLDSLRNPPPDLARLLAAPSHGSFMALCSRMPASHSGTAGTGQVWLQLLRAEQYFRQEGQGIAKQYEHVDHENSSRHELTCLSSLACFNPSSKA